MGREAERQQESINVGEKAVFLQRMSPQQLISQRNFRQQTDGCPHEIHLYTVIAPEE